MGKLKYLNQLTEEELKNIGSELDFRFISEGFRCGSSLTVRENIVVFSSWDENYRSSDDYDYNTLRLNDFEIIGTEYEFDFQVEKQVKFVKMMAKKIKETNKKKE